MEQIHANQEQLINQEQRLYDDVTTWLAETLDGSMRTPFTYTFDGQELYARDGGAMKVVFEDALEAAKTLPADLRFEHRRRLYEYDEYHEMVAMMRGELPNTMVVISDFPPELMAAHNDVGGYNVERKQTMLRVITKNEDGTLSMRSQSLDGSNRQALEEIYYQLGFKPEAGELISQRIHLELDDYNQEFIIDKLTSIYDRALEQMYGGTWKAGKNVETLLNTYDFVCAQSDLVGMYMQNANKFGDHPEFLHNIVAAIHKRFEQSTKAYSSQTDIVLQTYPINQSALIDELLSAGKEAEHQGKTFSGCGLTIGGNSQNGDGELSELGYGNKTGEDKYGSLTFKCPKGHTNHRPRNTLIPKCTTCGTSVRC